MTDKLTVVAALNASRPIPAPFGSVTPTMILRCRDDEFDAYINFDTTVHDYSPRIRLDDGEVIRDHGWSQSTGMDARFADEPVQFVKALLQAKRLRFGFHPYGRAEAVADFNLAGLANVLPRLKKACPVAFAGGPPASPMPSLSPTISTDAPVRVAGNIAAPQKIADFKAVYPPIAQSARVQGVVIIDVTIGPDGTVKEARVLSGQPLLNEAAREAVLRWKYTPTLLNGVPVSVIMTVTVPFTLK